jgi:protease I
MAKVAILVGAGFEDSEFDVPHKCLEEAGHEVTVLGENEGEKLEGKRGDVTATVEQAVCDAYPDNYDALVIPGGHGPDALRIHQDAVDFVRGFMESGKPVAAICHGPQLLIEAEEVRGRTITSWPSVRTDLLNAGASWVDEPVVIDDNLITSRKPDDLDDFCKAVTERLAS